MDFIIQQNLLNNSMLLKIRSAVAGFPHKFVGLIPFSREITSDEPIAGVDHIPYGSTSFVEAALGLGWKGLYFHPAVFDYFLASRNRDDMLNAENFFSASLLSAYLDSLPADKDIFIRPSHDLKQFSGQVMKTGEASAFIKDALQFTGTGSYKLDPEMQIVVAEPKNIAAESRWFIVGGKAIDGSYYRMGGQLRAEHIQGTHITAPFIDGWLPHPCCVMDLAHMPDGSIKVIEFNCINGSGFYEHDIGKVMSALYQYTTSPV